MFFIIISGLIAFLVAFFLPFDWWRMPPARQPDRFIGKLLPFLTISLRNIVLRLFFLGYFLFAYLQTLLFIPVIAGVFVVGAVLGSAWQRIRGKSAEPVAGLLLLLALGCVFAIGIIAPLRIIPIGGYLFLGRPAGNIWEALTVGTGWLTLDSVIGLCGMFGVASWMLVDAVWRFRQARQVENLPTSRIGSLAMGLIEAQGVVKPVPGSNSESPVELSYGMADYFKPVQKIKRFLLEDRSGSALVDATDCRVRAGWVAEVAAIFGTREIVLTKRVARDDFTDTVVKRLEYGDRVYVIGNAERNASGNTVIRPARRPAWSEALWKTLFGAIKPPREKDIHDVFFLTDGSEREAKEHILKGFRTVLVWGLLWIAASATIIVTAQQPWRLAPPPDSWRSSFWRGPEPNPNPLVLDYTRNDRLFRFERYIKTVGPKSYDQIAALIEAIGYKDYRFYEPATNALMRMMPEAKEQAKAALPLLINHLNPCTWNAEALQTMIIAVGRFGPEAAPAVPKLIEALQCKHTNTYVVTPFIIRFQAARALGEIGPSANEAVPALREALNDPSGIVKAEAETALRRITGEPAP